MKLNFSLLFILQYWSHGNSPAGIICVFQFLGDDVSSVLHILCVTQWRRNHLLAHSVYHTCDRFPYRLTDSHVRAIHRLDIDPLTESAESLEWFIPNGRCEQKKGIEGEEIMRIESAVEETIEDCLGWFKILDNRVIKWACNNMKFI